MGELDFGDGLVLPCTAGRLMLWLLWTSIGAPVPVVSILGVSQKAAMMRIYREADALGQYSPKHAAALRNHVHFEGGVATFRPAHRCR
ncbi:hypothetical protein ASG35_03020 [Burkholderia sp. Leaf177]|uniref:hypothetical protein n=1 Tax=Burkholderia sp. Leaf177 TaxID=1736287 RepID=UPI0006FF8F92|nr:hypothetical protein [Burkholderia sp. Leaf177]KQR90197.1 hypothetical protein ASG35_03020 [Burkholderia sp. Leaf177]